MKDILITAKQLRLCRSLDIHFAYMIAKPFEPALMLASACLSVYVGNGYAYLPLECLTPIYLFDNQCPILAEKAWNKAGSPSSPKQWQKLLLAASSTVSDGTRPTPLVLDNQRLYLQRMWHDEYIVAQFFHQIKPYPVNTSKNKIAVILDEYFPSNSSDINWQKIAVAISITRSVSLISGGPGTGKTFIIAKLLAVLAALNDDKIQLRVILAAPTSRAAARLNEFLDIELQQLKLPEKKKQQLLYETITFRHLFGKQSNNNQYMQFRHGYLTNLDVLIINQASMIDLSMMARLIMKLSCQTRLILIGDCCQLSSINIGSMLGDICQFSKTGYSTEKREELQLMTGFTLPAGRNDGNYSIADSICLLRKNYRFKQCSDIYRLANMIKIGNITDSLALLKSSEVVKIKNILDNEILEYQTMIQDCVNGYRDYLLKVRHNAAPINILNTFNRFRLLCALYDGPFGVTELNCCIEQALREANLLTTANGVHSNYYAGRPIIILDSMPSLGIYNGDIGLFLLSEEIKKTQYVYFLLPSGNIKILQRNYLPKHETAFAITVHNSQNLEFDHTMLALPNQFLPILTRELIYTAVIRARTCLSIYSSDKILQHAIITTTQQRNGLIDRMMASAVFQS
ncbi:exodeoxyribonuclease V subunit alpha [Candidatus Curculioniphilus buchneri]|uniref:exodeoxyribonuclease V subunit alpha n=1 Tax=Candidatus Curculioniphilus buchneri TaxID=690594 RepID=UPI00376F0A3A